MIKNSHKIFIYLQIFLLQRKMWFLLHHSNIKQCKTGEYLDYLILVKFWFKHIYLLKIFIIKNVVLLFIIITTNINLYNN